MSSNRCRQSVAPSRCTSLLSLGAPQETSSQLAGLLSPGNACDDLMRPARLQGDSVCERAILSPRLLIMVFIFHLAITGSVSSNEPAIEWHASPSL